jgi:hypothetical protein
MKVIVWTNSEGRLHITYPAWNDQKVGESEEAFLDRVKSRCVSIDATEVRIVNRETIPADRSFRDAWTHSGSFGVDMPKARDIHREKLRHLRKPKLEALDVETMRNLTNSSKLAEIEAQKQALRDATAYPAIDSAGTPEQLKVAIPPCLA